MKAYELTLSVGGAVGHVIVGGGVFNAYITDLTNKQTALYTVYLLGVGVGLPAVRLMSRPLRFTAHDDTTSRSF